MDASVTFTHTEKIQMENVTLETNRNETNKFTVEERDECFIIFGTVSLRAMPNVLKLAGDDAILSPDIARMLGANFAFGTKTCVDALLAKIKPLADAGMIAKYSSTLSDAACRWLACGERGASSDTMFTHLTGVDAGGGDHFPWDPADFRRCLLLLEQVPELRDQLPKMATVSTEWAGLVRDWSKISAAFLIECKNILNPKPGSQAPNTYNLIKIAIGQKK